MRKGRLLAMGAFTAIVVVATAAAAPTVPTGTLVFATAGDRADRFEIAVAKADGTGVRKITHNTPGGEFPTWSADGQRIIFRSQDSATNFGRLWSVKKTGTGLHAVRRYGEPSPSATRFARPTLAGVDIFSHSGKLLRHLPLRLGADDFYDDPAVFWSPDDRALAISVATESERADYERIFVARVDGHDPPRALSARIRRGGSDEFPLAWSRDGRTLLLEQAGRAKAWKAFLVTAATGERRRVRNDFLRRPFDTSADLASVTWVSRSGTIFSAQLAGGPRHAIAQAHGTTTGVGSVHLSLSPSGREVAYADQDGIHVVDLGGRHNRRLTRLGPWSYPEWSPSGTRLTFSVGSQAIYTVGRRGKVRLVTRSMWDDTPQWSPDGTHIALTRGPNGLRDLERTRVVVIERSNPSRPQLLGRGDGPRWNSDGGLVAFVDRAHSPDPRGFDRLAAGDIVVAAPDGTSRRTIANGTAPVWSPRAARLLFLRYTFEEIGHALVPTATHVFVVDADGTGLREVPVPEGLILFNPDWSPDGHTVIFDSVDGNYVSSALFVDVDRPERTHGLDFADASSYVWSPDGQWIAFDDGAVKVARPDGTGIRTVSRRFFELWAPVWSPDQNALAFEACHKPPTKDVDVGTCDIYVAAADGSGQTQVTKTPGVEQALDWSAR